MTRVQDPYPWWIMLGVYVLIACIFALVIGSAYGFWLFVRMLR